MNEFRTNAANNYEEQKGIPFEPVDGEQFAGLIVEHVLKTNLLTKCWIITLSHNK